MLSSSTMILMPSCSKTRSPSRCSSSASWYWKPEQPPPRTATRRPAFACSSSERRVPIFWAATSVSVTTTIILVGEPPDILDPWMPTAQELKERIETALPGAQADVEDLTGGGDHFRAEIVSDRFAGLSRIEQHKLVYDVFGDEIGGPIHAPFPKTTPPEGGR